MTLHCLTQSAVDIPASDDWLGPRESAILAGLRFPKRRADWRLGRWTAKRAVSACLLTRDPPAAIEILAAASGAPEVFIRGRPAPLAISLSHSAATGFCAVAPRGAELGCDVETIASRSPAFLSDYFTDDEQALVARTAPKQRDLLITLLWSAKESVLKALRCGLRCDTRGVIVTPGSDRLSARHSSGRTFHGRWWTAGDLLWTVVLG